MSGPRPALVIAAHGSRSEGWGERVQEFANHVREFPGLLDAYAAVHVAFLEHTSPSIPDAVTVALEAGCSEVVVIPLFLTVSTHVGEDVPGVLGLDVPDHVRQRLRGEGKRCLAPGLPVRLVTLGDADELLANNALRRLALRSRDKSEEAVVLCAYGSSIHHDKWEELMHAVRMRLMQAGYSYAGHAYVGHTAGLSPEPTEEAVRKAGHMAGVKRVHVLPMLMSVSKLQTEVIARAAEDASDDKRFTVHYTEDAILPDGDLAAHAAVVALSAIGVFPTMGRGARA